jgi:DNA-binding response OmpR family regulator
MFRKFMEFPIFRGMTDAEKSSFKVLIADDDGQTRRRLSDFLKEKGFEVTDCEDGNQVKRRLVEWKPHFVIIDLMLPEGNAMDIMSFMKTNDVLKDLNIRTLVTSGHNSAQNVRDSLKAGASDYIIKPFKFDDMLSRLVFHIQKKRKIDEAIGAKADKTSGAEFYLHLIDMVLREANSGKRTQDVCYNLTKMLALTLKAVRCSIIECYDDRQTGFVQASSDDKAVQSIKIDLNRYPEVLHVMNTEKVVVIEDLDYDPMLAKIRDLVKTIRFDAMIVCPIKRDGKFYGVVSARMKKLENGFTDHDIRFAQVIAYVMGLVISADRPMPIEMRRSS